MIKEFKKGNIRAILIPAKGTYPNYYKIFNFDERIGTISETVKLEDVFSDSYDTNDALEIARDCVKELKKNVLTDQSLDILDGQYLSSEPFKFKWKYLIPILGLMKYATNDYFSAYKRDNKDVLLYSKITFVQLFINAFLMISILSLLGLFK